MQWRAFPLHPETPEEGQLLEDLFRTSPEKIKPMIARLRESAQELGLPFGERTKTYNSRLAQELGLWAEDEGKGDAFHMAAFYGYFRDGLNLANDDVLIKLVIEAGLPEDDAGRVIRHRLYREQVDRDWADSQLRGITAVPTFVMGKHKLIGAQSYETLEALAIHYKTAKNNSGD